MILLIKINLKGRKTSGGVGQEATVLNKRIRDFKKESNNQKRNQSSRLKRNLTKMKSIMLMRHLEQFKEKSLLQRELRF